MQNNVTIFNLWWNRNNYGAMLTAFALQEIIKHFNKTPNSFDDIGLSKKNFFGNKFTKIYLNTIGKDNSYKTVEELNKITNIFIAGSDQIFRAGLLYKRYSKYFLDFADADKKKIAFSASFGVDKEEFLEETSDKIIEKMKTSLKSFDFISVREKSGVEICKDLFNVDAEWIIDPVFILDKSKYDELIETVTPPLTPPSRGGEDNQSPHPITTSLNGNEDNQSPHPITPSLNEKEENQSPHPIIPSLNEKEEHQSPHRVKEFSGKIVAYVLDTSKEYKKAYKYLEKKYNKKVIETANSNISVESWLKSIRDCDLFVTDSFHGMCFAMIFNKPFICLANKSRGRTRFDSICEMLNVENQCIDSILEVMQRDCVFKIDYNVVNQRIEEERQKGFNFLKKALDAPIQITQEKIDARMKYLEQRVCELEEQNNLSYQLKHFLWEKWLIVYHGYLPKSIKNIISFFWQIIKKGRKQ